ncbi:amidase family protein [Candidatus Vidania fulgoroideorum]
MRKIHKYNFKTFINYFKLFKNYFKFRIAKYNNNNFKVLEIHNFNKYYKFSKFKSSISNIPYTIKNVFSKKGSLNLANSRVLTNYIQFFNCTIYNILKNNNCIFLGKNVLDEFAIGSYGTGVSNPWNSNIFAGGSSSGSAVSVSKGMCMFSIGSDTGGSVRLPASLNGLVGLKPTYGTISRYGMVSFAPTFDTVGIICSYADDLLNIIKKIQIKDKNDLTMTSFNNNVLKKRKILIPYKVFNSRYIDYETKNCLNKVILFFLSNKYEVIYFKKVDNYFFKFSNSLYYVLSSIESISSLARFDSIRYGYKSKKIIYKNIDDIYKIRDKYLSNSVIDRINYGKISLEKFNYFKLQKKREFLKKKIKNYLKNCYTLLPVFSFKELSSKTKNIDMYNTIANLTGFPSVCFRVGYSLKMGIPICFQIMGIDFDERNILDIISSFQNEKV